MHNRAVSTRRSNAAHRFGASVDAGSKSAMTLPQIEINSAQDWQNNECESQRLCWLAAGPALLQSRPSPTVGLVRRQAPEIVPRWHPHQPEIDPNAGPGSSPKSAPRLAHDLGPIWGRIVAGLGSRLAPCGAETGGVVVGFKIGPI